MNGDNERVYQEPEMAVSEFILKPEVPQRYKDIYDRFWSFVSHLSAVSNISEWTIQILLIRLDRVSQCFNLGLYDYGNELCVRTMATLQLSRGKDGFYTKQAATTRSIQEMKEITQQAKKAAWGPSKWFKKKEEKEGEL